MSDILLDTLISSLDTDTVDYIQSDASVRQQSEKFLSELLINDDLLSTETYTASSTSNTKPTLIEVIAEIESRQHDINVELASITDQNKDLIIDISEDLHTIESTIRNDYGAEIETMLGIVSENGADPDKFHISVNEKLTSSIKSSNSILSHLDSVLDFLELPTLCRLCILQGNYQEALEISVLVQSLVIRFPKLTLFQKISEQVQNELRSMVKGLIKLLNTSLKQNSILKIFQILNKLQADQYMGLHSFDDKDKFLKLVFLNARFKFILSEISNLKPLIKFNKWTYLKRYIEIYREFIFNSLSIYHTIFVNEETKSGQDKILINQFIRKLAGLLSQELTTYLPELLASAQSEEDQIDTQSQKDGLILQITYLCKSLSKYNVDFEAVIIFNLGEGLISEDEWTKNLAKVKKFRQ